MIVMGVDNGKSGAIAVLLEDFSLLLSDMPTGKGALKRRFLHCDADNSLNDYRPREILELIDHALAIDQDLHVIIEEPAANMLGRGRSRMSTLQDLSRALGIWEAVCDQRQLVPLLVSAQTWKAHWGLHGKGKEGSLAKASSLHPLDWPSPDHAEAYLIARWYLNDSRCAKFRQRS